MTILGILCFGIRIYRGKIRRNRSRTASDSNLDEHTDQASMDSVQSNSNSGTMLSGPSTREGSRRSSIQSSSNPFSDNYRPPRRQAPLPPREPASPRAPHSNIPSGENSNLPTSTRRRAPLPPRRPAPPRVPSPTAQSVTPRWWVNEMARPPRRPAPPPPYVPRVRPDGNTGGDNAPNNPPPYVQRSPDQAPPPYEADAPGVLSERGGDGSPPVRPPPYQPFELRSPSNEPSAIRKRRSINRSNDITSSASSKLSPVELERKRDILSSSMLGPDENTLPNNVKVATILKHSPMNSFDSDSVGNVKSSAVTIYSKLDHKLRQNSDESYYIWNELTDKIEEPSEHLTKFLSYNIKYAGKGRTKRDLNYLKLKILRYNIIDRRNNDKDTNVNESRVDRLSNLFDIKINI